MLRKLIACLTGLLLALPVFGQERPTIQSIDASAAWRSDLAVLVERMEAAHPNLYWRVSEAAFRGALDDLAAEIPYLSDEQIALGIVQVTALIDGHTSVNPFQPAIGFHVYPLHVYRFSDGLFVIDAQDENAIGARIVSINGHAAEAVYTQMIPFAPYDNPMTQASIAPLYLTIPEALLAVGIIADVQRPNFLLEHADGTRLTLNPSPQTLDQVPEWHTGHLMGLNTRTDTLYLSRFNDEAFWFDYLADSDTLYIQYNAVERRSGSTPMATFARDISAFLSANDPARIVVDVRHNGGGDNTTYGVLINALSQSDQFNERGRFFVITSRHTFSAAKDFIGDLIHAGGEPLLVGEPSGGRPNNYGDTRPFTLPNSGIEVRVATRFSQRGDSAEDPRDQFEVDIPVSLSSADYFADVDPALEAILAYQR